MGEVIDLRIGLALVGLEGDRHGVGRTGDGRQLQRQVAQEAASLEKLGGEPECLGAAAIAVSHCARHYG